MINTIKKYRYLVFTILLSLGLVSCEDFFIRELEIPRQEMDNRLVVHGFISPLDSMLVFNISNNYALDDTLPEPTHQIDGAKVRISQNGQILYEFGQDPDGNYTLMIDEWTGLPGTGYLIEVDHPDYERALIETEMPEYVSPVSVNFTKDGGFAGANGKDKLDLIEVTFNDPPGQANYYEFQLNQLLIDYEEITFPGDTTIIILETRYPDRYFTPDTNFEQGISGFLLSDKSFDGQSYTFQIMISADEEIEDIPIDRLKLYWNCISRDHYEYAKSLLQYQRSSGFGLFSDPVAVYSNVENGLGIVSVRNTRAITPQEK